MLDPNDIMNSGKFGYLTVPREFYEDYGGQHGMEYIHS